MLLEFEADAIRDTRTNILKLRFMGCDFEGLILNRCVKPIMDFFLFPRKKNTVGNHTKVVDLFAAKFQCSNLGKFQRLQKFRVH